ncbi:MAG: hypothetical protein KAS63_03360 [Candidatus Heimdallarchaeota archaeon]|nr:hypothetical protein [Candidatus Heimdallarchaeota archaeon]MCK4954375.1 hypothetical protein [Candidatus Heimdallarchaeota archaeon]
MRKAIKFAPLSKISFQKQPQKNLEVILVVKGYLPDSASQLKDEEVLMNENEKEVHIKILIQRDPSVMAMQVIRNFVKEIPLIFTREGKWKIKCNDKTLETDVTI